MKALKYVYTVLLFSIFLISASVAKAQVPVTEEILNDGSQTEQVDKKKDKKKDEDKESKLDIDSMFYINLLINTATVALLILLIYYPNYKNKEAVFTFMLFNISIFLLTYLMNQIKISMGAAFGLFAVFSMLRYRTEGINMKDMTYLFIVIAIGLISAIRLESLQLLLINGILFLFIVLLDGNILFKREFSKRIVYDNIELIKPENNEALIKDLKARTGLNIKKVSIVKVDFLKDTANLDVIYQNGKHKNIIESSTTNTNVTTQE
jgi:hypothetical protein